MTTSLYVLATAFIASGSLTPLVRRLAIRTGLVDKPNARKIHRNPMPLLGGLAIYLGAILTILLFGHNQSLWQIIGVLVGATLLLIVGILDDRGLLHHQVKLMLAMPGAALLLLASGVRLSYCPVDPFPPTSTVPLFLCSSLLSFVWVVGITAAFSILDHMDGLCAGVAAVAAAFFLIFTILNGQMLVGILAAAVLGAALGFLPWNFNPAKIFMGDGGAMFLGFTMAALGLALDLPNIPQQQSWLIPVLILGVPICDTTLVTISRMRRGLLPFASPGKDHIAHRLSNLGLGQRGAVLSLYTLGALFGLLALLVRSLSTSQSLMLAVIVLIGVLVGIVLLERAPYERQHRHAEAL